jgi:hypothetical protein
VLSLKHLKNQVPAEFRETIFDKRTENTYCAEKRDALPVVVAEEGVSKTITETWSICECDLTYWR